jgi:hypothetical protein
MKCYIVIYQHRHGADAWPIFDCKPPTEAGVIAELGDRYERGESIEIRGPFPAPRDRSAHEALRNLYVSACDTRRGYADRDLHERWMQTQRRAYDALVSADPHLATEIQKP